MVSRGLRAPVEGENTQLALLGGSGPQIEGVAGEARLKIDVGEHVLDQDAALV